MRIPVTSQLSTKEGTSNKNARLTNCLKESKKSGDKAVIRPGLVTSDTYTGIGSGLIPFDGRLLLIYDDTVYDDVLETFPWPLDSSPWASGTTYTYGDAVWYNGTMYFSQTSGNIGNTPSSSSEWGESYAPAEWDAGATYVTSEPVIYSGVRYYSWREGNVGNTPSSSPLDWRATAPNLNYTISNIVYTPPYPKPFPGTTTASWEIYNGAVLVGYGAGSYTSTLDSGTGIATASASNWPNTEPVTGFTQPTPPPGTVFSGYTEWSGNVGWTNYAWFPAQSSGSWYAVG